MKNFKLIVSVLCCIFSTSLMSQGFFQKLSPGINMNLKSPQGLLRDNGLTNFYGGSLELFYVGCNESKFKFTPGYRIALGITKSIEGNIVAIEEPAGAFAEEKLFNYYFGFEAVGRVIYDLGKWYRSYVEVYTGPRGFSAQERLVLEEPTEGYSNNSQSIFSNASLATGLGLGVLAQLSDDVDLNLKVGGEYIGRVDHSNLNQKDAYSTERIVSQKTFSHNLSIGILWRPQCGIEDTSSTTEKRRTSPSAYRPNNSFKKTRKIKRSKTIKT